LRTLRTETLALLKPPALSADGASLFLDLDGTLADFELLPELVKPDRRRTDVLTALKVRLDGRLAVISGRTLDDIDRIVEGSVVAAAGVHGLDRRSAAGKRVTAHPDPALGRASDVLARLSKTHPGVLVEPKGLSVAAHYRNAPSAEASVIAAAEHLAASTGLSLQRGDMVAELRTPGQNKGGALKAFMQEPPFRGSIPIFVGDDLTDEAGFAAALEFDGYGVLVGKLRPTMARFCLPSVTSVLDWLAAAT